VTRQIRRGRNREREKGVPVISQSSNVKCPGKGRLGGGVKDPTISKKKLGKRIRGNEDLNRKGNHRRVRLIFKERERRDLEIVLKGKRIFVAGGVLVSPREKNRQGKKRRGGKPQEKPPQREGMPRKVSEKKGRRRGKGVGRMEGERKGGSGRTKTSSRGETWGGEEGGKPGKG